jgi:anti-anti-sigma factor
MCAESMPQLHVDVSAGFGRTIVVAKGELDLATRDQLRTCLADCQGDVVVDLAAVDLLDSSAIGVLVGQRNRLLREGGSLGVRDPLPHVRTVLQTVGLGDWLVSD